jgi:hypothetical protein
MEAPEKIGLIPGVLQHASSEVGERHYNLARSVQAGRRFAAHLNNAKQRLRPLATKSITTRASGDHNRSRADSGSNTTDRPARDEALMMNRTIQYPEGGGSSCA